MKRRTARAGITQAYAISCLVSPAIAGALGLVACSGDASLGKNTFTTAGSSSNSEAQGGVPTNAGGATSTSGAGGSSGAGARAEAGGSGSAVTSGPTEPDDVASAGSGGSASAGGRAGAAGNAGSAGTTGNAGSGGIAGAIGDGGATNDAGSAGHAGTDVGVRLTAVRESGTTRVLGEWHNGSGVTIFLRGCSTTDGWYREGGTWKEYGAFAVCAQEGLAVEVPAGADHRDPAGGTPPNRGDGVWRLVGPYGIGCRSGVRFSEANCAEIIEVTSVNEITVP
jgi:hypothetical protein